MNIEAVKSRIITKSDSIITTIIDALKNRKIQDREILVITSKVLAVTQGRIAKIKSETDFIKLVKKEADQIIINRNVPKNALQSVMLTIKNGIFIPWAGIDRSNIQKGYCVLWPKNPFKEAEKIQETLKKYYKLKNLGIIIADSACVPLRQGVHSIALGYAGFKGVNDLRGQKDIFGNSLKVTQQAIADNLATAASVLMGEANDQKPFALIRNAPVKFENKTMKPTEPLLSKKDCIFSPLYL